MMHIRVVQHMRNSHNFIQDHFIVIWAQQIKLFDHVIKSLQYGCSNTFTVNMGIHSRQCTACISPPQLQSIAIANDPLGNIMLLDWNLRSSNNILHTCFSGFASSLLQMQPQDDACNG